ncbi:6-phospho-beta-glucosidase [Lactiplantibacillus paraplantarum]|uniref:6-phospho-beta-glucosidase n=1 Tax=Lactiplantibacillus paraplantarum TaxID=60520 RepID=A0ABQ0NF71_9LACO|nr:glycoside hydrolase family 1 protein [Lactiplantibacillus paraplantarum]GBF03710.1 6-phospho-beta-glucosidase [Lactiplantibacillus paraplantarum]
MKFENKFLWGGATAANQIEGGFLEDESGDSISDHLTQGSKTKVRKFTKTIDSNEYYPSHKGIDFYHDFPEDIKLLGKLGIRAFRLSIKWSRIFPNGDESEPNKKGLQYYDRIFDELHKYNIAPVVTLSHFDMPINLVSKYNGFANRIVVDLFVRYASTVIKYFKDKVKYWITFNEINFACLPTGNLEVLGVYNNATTDYTNPIDNQSLRYQALHNVFIASALTVKYAHSLNLGIMVGCMISHVTLYPLTSHPTDQTKTQEEDALFNNFCGDVQVKGEYPFYIKKYFDDNNIKISIFNRDKQILKEGTVDYYTFSYYMSNCVSHSKNNETTAGNLLGGVKNPYLKMSDWGWQIDPEGLYYTLFKIYDRYHLPIMISENGFGAQDVIKNGVIHDQYRIEYLKKHIYWMKKAINQGINVFSYMVWSPFDIVSSSTGEMDKRYGLIYTDMNSKGEGSLARIPKDSFYWYQSEIKKGLTSSL